MTYLIYFGDGMYTVDGTEAAWSAYKTACDLADMIGEPEVMLLDYDTGETIAAMMK